MYDVWSKVPALPAAVGLGAGIFVGYWYCSGWDFLPLAAVVATMILTGLAVFLLRSRAVGLCCMVLGFGVLLGYVSVPVELPAELADKECTLEGTVVKATRTPETLCVVLHVDSVGVTGGVTGTKEDFNVLCSVRTSDAGALAGAKMRVHGKLQPIYHDTDVPLQVDFNRFLYLDGIVARVTVYSSEDYRIDNAGVGMVRRVIDDMQQRWRAAITDAGFDEDVTAFMLAVIGGDDMLLSEDMATQFREAGLSHVLAISGMHVGIILFVLSLFLLPLKLVFRLRWLYYAGLAALIVLYALITGGSPSACRAAATCCVVMGGFMMEGRLNMVQSLSCAVLILMVISPVMLFMPGFQLSVCAVAGIIAFRPLLEVVPKRYRLLRFVWVILWMPLIAMAGTLVPTLFYFHIISVNFWVANIVAAAFIPILLSVGFVCTLLSLSGFAPGWLAEATDAVYTAMTRAVGDVVNLFPSAQVAVLPSGLWLAMLCVILAGVVWLVWNYSHRRAAVVGVGALVLLWLVPVAEADALPATEVYVPGRFATTNIIVRDGGTCRVFTTAPDSSSVEALRQDMQVRYREFLLHRGVNELVITTDWPEEVFEICGLTIVKVDSVKALPDRHYDYALVTERFRGDLQTVFRGCQVDTVLLSGAIAPRRCKQLSWQLSQAGIPARSLRARGVVWQFQ